MSNAARGKKDKQNVKFISMTIPKRWWGRRGAGDRGIKKIDHGM
jgi:hypothetical protein